MVWCSPLGQHWPMCIRQNLDEGLQRVWLTVLPAPQTATVAETVLRLIRQRPILGSWDWIIDLRAPHEKATPDELDQIATAFNAARSKQSYTIFISADPLTRDRCTLMDTKFLDRRNLVARTPEEAESLLPRSMRSI